MSLESTVLELPNYSQFNHLCIQMSLPIIFYKEKTASVQQVITHLTKCGSNFVPPLNQTVDISAYSKKIVENSITFEAWIDNELAGLIAAYFNDEKKITGFITNVSTVINYSGRGIASQLLQNCIHYGVKHQFESICLEVNDLNKSAIHLYNKYGFNKTGNNNKNVLMKKDL